MSGYDPITVYDGEPAAVVFLRSLMDAAGIELVSTGGAFFGPPREIRVRRRDEAEAREIVAHFESHQARGKGDVLRGPWSTD